MAEYVLVSSDNEGVASVTLNRPDKHNAFDEQVIAELTAAFGNVGSDPAVRVVVIRSEGRSFSAGADANWMKRMAGYSREENIRDANGLARMLHTLNFLPKPTIARVQGAAMGGGVGLVCCCDVAVAADNASFAFSEVKLGLIPATISPYVLQAIGARAARRYFLSGESFSADQARQLGLVSEVATAENLDARVNEFARTLLRNSASAMATAKRLIVDVEGKTIDDTIVQFTSESIAEARASDEAREGLIAFLEKRKPAWSK